jgi:membrane associated rhomboid family serine protease
VQKPSPSEPRLGQRLSYVAGVAALFWLLELVDRLLLDGALDNYGIRPRTTDGLWGIPLAPFLHGDFAHLASNTIPFVVLGGLVAMRGLAEFCEVSLIVVIVGGLGTWLFGESGTVHIGASGLVFGYFGCLTARGFLEANVVSILVGLLVLFLYGGIVWGVLPTQPGVSWQGHLFGLLGGAAAGWILTRLGQRKAPFVE